MKGEEQLLEVQVRLLPLAHSHPLAFAALKYHLQTELYLLYS
jgi:hypothetical protein